MDSRLTLRDMSIGFSNDQKAGKSKIAIEFEELEEKPSIIKFEFPNPYLERDEIISYLNSRVERINEAIREYLSLRPPPITKTKSKKNKGFPTKKEEDNVLDEFEE